MTFVTFSMTLYCSHQMGDSDESRFILLPKHEISNQLAWTLNIMRIQKKTATKEFTS